MMICILFRLSVLTSGSELDEQSSQQHIAKALELLSHRYDDLYFVPAQCVNEW